MAGATWKSPFVTGGAIRLVTSEAATAAASQPSARLAYTRCGSIPKERKATALGTASLQGHAVVFWTNALEERARDWLTPAFHAVFHKLMPHAATRERLLCTAYCLMPDHLHLLWMGLRRESDQFNAMKFLRTQLEPALGNGREWQHQPHDHVLLEEERRRNAFARFCFYTLANPVRAGLVTREHDWSCLFVLCLETWGPDFRRSWILQLRSHTAYERRTRIAFPEKLMKLS